MVVFVTLQQNWSHIKLHWVVVKGRKHESNLFVQQLFNVSIDVVKVKTNKGKQICLIDYI